jgi:murein DD-endopeptidase MepM/ murein hydrolase activator NlpD
VLAALGLGLAADHIESASAGPAIAAAIRAPRSAAHPAQPAHRASLTAPETGRLHERALRNGETLGRVFADLGLTATDAQQASVELARYVNVRQLPVGARFAAAVNGSAQLAAFQLEVGGKGIATLERRGEAWSSDWHAFERLVQPRSIHGTLEGSLDESIERAGAPADLAYAMGEVLQWDLDFNRDLRLGDTFQVLFEEVFLDGKPAGLGNVLAVRYVNRGRSVEAFRFSDAAYYDAQGRPLQKMFLRSPIPYSRITSRFSMHRFHPILNVVRPHYGVDYGAPVGTPARVTADGVVTFVGWDGGGGRAVKVRHPNDYLTCYLHLSRFPAGLSPGDRVRQGEVIGYVGASGLATGPHLDYRVQHHGGWIDPLGIKSVPSEPVPTALIGRFRAWRDAMVASLESGQPLRLPSAAANEPVLAQQASSSAGATAARR